MDDGGTCSILDVRIFSPPSRSPKLKGQEACVAMCSLLSTAASGWVSAFGFRVNLLVVEGQRVHSKTKNWDNITALGPVSGACLASTLPYLRPLQRAAAIPYPDVWTGGIPKYVRQSRMWRRWNLPYEIRGTGAGRYSVPRESCRHGLGIGHWKHLGDAVGIAEWALLQL